MPFGASHQLWKIINVNGSRKIKSILTPYSAIIFTKQMSLQICSQNKMLFLPSQLSDYNHNLKRQIFLKILEINKTEKNKGNWFPLAFSCLPKSAYFPFIIIRRHRFKKLETELLFQKKKKRKKEYTIQ